MSTVQIVCLILTCLTIWTFWVDFFWPDSIDLFGKPLDLTRAKEINNLNYIPLALAFLIWLTLLVIELCSDTPLIP